MVDFLRRQVVREAGPVLISEKEAAEAGLDTAPVELSEDHKAKGRSLLESVKLTLAMPMGLAQRKFDAALFKDAAISKQCVDAALRLLGNTKVPDISPVVLRQNKPVSEALLKYLRENSTTDVANFLAHSMKREVRPSQPQVSAPAATPLPPGPVWDAPRPTAPRASGGIAAPRGSMTRRLLEQANQQRQRSSGSKE